MPVGDGAPRCVRAGADADADDVDVDVPSPDAAGCDAPGFAAAGFEASPGQGAATPAPMTTTPAAQTAAAAMCLLDRGFRAAADAGTDGDVSFATGRGLAGGGGSRGGAAAAIGTDMGACARGRVTRTSSLEGTGATSRSRRVVSASSRCPATACRSGGMVQNRCVDTRSGGT